LMAYIGPLFNQFGENFIPKEYNSDNSGPSRTHLLGQGNLGKDLLAQIEAGTQRSLYIALIVMAVAGLIGVIYGSTSGYFGGRADNVMMRVLDFFLVVPSLVVLLVVSQNFPKLRAFWAIGLFLALFGWFDLARLVRGSFLSLREREFIEAAHSIGTSNRRIIFKHLVPNAAGTIIVWLTLAGATAVLGEATLSFLGFGSQGGYSLGRLVAEGVAAADTRPWMFYFPGIAMVLIVLSINLIGDGIRDAVDPSNAKVRA
ncbi:MAG: ABC transporter permease, partial [Antricoccus sp.]